MRKPITLVLLMLVLLAACGREGSLVYDRSIGDDLAAAPRADDRPSAAPAEDTEEPEETPEPTPEPTEEPEVTPEPQTPPPTADPGSVNRPAPGIYTYEVSGQGTNPMTGQPQSFEGDQQNELTHEGDLNITRTRSEEQGAEVTTHERWSANRVELTYMKVEVPPLGTFECTLDPPILMMRIPIRPEVFSTQSIRGEGNACGGEVDIEWVGQTTTNDAGGRTWDVWEARVRLLVEAEGFIQESEETRWFSPALGVQVRGEGTSEVEANAPPFGTINVDSEQTSALKSWP